MNDYKKIPTSAEVWAVIRARHPELKVFSSYSAPDGDQFGNPDVCKMMTVYGFDGCDFPVIGAETTWDRSPENNYERLNERHIYWICIAENCDDVVVMYAGRIAEKAETLTLFKDPRHPYTKGLLTSIPSLAKEPKTILPTIRGNVPSLLDMPKGCRFASRCPMAQDICRKTVPLERPMGQNHTAACHFADAEI